MDPALGGQVAPFPTAASVGNLQFDAEKVDAYELGMKYTGRKFRLNVATPRRRDQVKVELLDLMHAA